MVFSNTVILKPYIAADGYNAAAKALTSMTDIEVVEELRVSGMRGRGGAGFPTGMKWEAGRKAQGDQKYLVCNADEGDPGAFMDRSIIEGDPHTLNRGYAYRWICHWRYKRLCICPCRISLSCGTIKLCH